ncbi:hypothetical protein PPYR_02700 [Photinus pyralis]|uniref:Methyltransferase type 11 domain-containing protein n=1 Tax=Photinus pyralis TaxID=7054 RepID=A0A5N4A0Q5_PHOPY|nr:juvenile hormone acid O-methyltransferase-like [Photinus pyralis]KAB0790900.1 hypothetical protein PPYR_02700 [Photinus pyralis]
MINRAAEYVKQSKLSQTGAKKFTKHIQETATWRDNCNVLDIGCGPGNVTYDYILPILPKCTNSIVAIDKRAYLVDYANERYGGKKSKIEFKHLDIVKDVTTLNQYANYFDHIFSFYCLQNILDHETALKNIFKILKPGGDLYFLYDAHNNLYDVCEYLLRTPEWEPVLHDYKDSLYDYHDSATPKQDLEELLVKVGFEHVYSTIENQEILLPMETMTEFAIAQAPFDIPPELERKFGLDGVDAVRTLKMNRFVEGREFCLSQFQELFGHHRKPIDAL